MSPTAVIPDVQVHIVDAPFGAGPESILPVVVMDSGLASSTRPGMTDWISASASLAMTAGALESSRSLSSGAHSSDPLGFSQ